MVKGSVNSLLQCLSSSMEKKQGLPMGGTSPMLGIGELEEGARTRHTASKEKREQGEARMSLGSGLESASLGSRTRRVNQGRLPRGGEYGAILQC